MYTYFIFPHVPVLQDTARTGVVAAAVTGIGVAAVRQQHRGSFH